MNHLSSSLVLCILCLSSQAFSQSETQMKAFSTELKSAWQANTDSAFDALYHKDGADQFQIDTMVSVWRREREYLPDAKLTIKAFYTKSELEKKAATEKGISGTFTNLLKLWNEPQVMNGHTYVPNLIITGFMQIEIRGAKGGGSVKFMDVGFNQEGKLRFGLLRLAREKNSL